MFSNNDPHGWEIRNREGKVVEKGFPSYAKAAARIHGFQTEYIKLSGRFIPISELRGIFFPVRSRG